MGGGGKKGGKKGGRTSRSNQNQSGKSTAPSKKTKTTTSTSSGGNTGGGGNSGGGNSGGGNSGGGNKGGNKRGSGKAGQGTVGGGQKTNPTKKSTPAPKAPKAPAPKKTTPAPKAKAPAPKPKPKSTPAPVAKKKEPTKAQQMAKDRIASGKTISQVKADNKASMQQKAAERDTKFKQTGVQTLGGKKETFTKAEQKKITDAGYSVAGYSKAPAQSNTQLQVNKDIAQYGNTVPEGSFGISEEGKALAAQQKAEAAAKKAAADKKAAAEAAEKARKAEEKRQIQFDTARLDPLATLTTNPLTDNNYFNLGRNVRIPNEDTASFRTLLKDDLSQVTRTDKAFKEGATGIKGFRPIKAFADPNMRATGPTPLVRQTVERFLPAGLRNISIGSQLFNQGREDSGLTQSLNRIDNTNIGGLSIGFKSPESTDLGARASRFVTDTIGKIAGGLNIGGASAQASEGGEAESSGRTGRVIGPKSIAALGADVISQAFAPRLADGTLTGNQDFAGRLPGDKGFEKKDVQIKQAVNNMMDSRFVQQAGENLGLPKNFKAQTKGALAALGENFKGATADRDGIYEGISETAKNLTLDPRLAPVAGYINQIATDNPNVSDAERSNRFKIAGFETPLTNETVADIVSGFQPDAEKFTGLSTKERGLIEGGAGNRIVSGKLTDIAREALIGDIGTGSTLGLAKGTPLSISNMVGAAGAIQKNLKDSGTLASKRVSEIGRLAGAKGDITTPSLIKGLIPGRIGSSGSGTRPNPLQITPTGAGGGSGFTPVPIQQPVEQIIPPLLPTGQPQSGQDPTALADIAQQSYTSALRSYGIDPGFFARIRPRRFSTPRPNSFRRSFIRRYF